MKCVVWIVLGHVLSWALHFFLYFSHLPSLLSFPSSLIIFEIIFLSWCLLHHPVLPFFDSCDYILDNWLERAEPRGILFVRTPWSSEKKKILHSWQWQKNFWLEIHCFRLAVTVSSRATVVPIVKPVLNVCGKLVSMFFPQGVWTYIFSALKGIFFLKQLNL